MASRFRVRRCNGNRNAWAMVALRPDGTEIDSYGGYKTALSLDALIRDPRSPKPDPGEAVEWVIS